MVRTYAQIYMECRKALKAQEDERGASVLARNLLCHFTGKSMEKILTDMDQTASEELVLAMEDATKRILNEEPLAYILGEWEFYGLKLHVNPNVLIPRDDTCAVVQLAINQALFLPDGPRVLDLCTGSGCIGLAIASRVRDARVTLADISKEALAVAKRNIQRNHLTGRISCYQADALGAAPAFLGKFDMIVSNPPYIDSRDMEGLEVSVKDYEPHMALFGGNDGLDFYRSITEKYRHNLKPGGYLCYEFGEDQGDDVCDILAANGFTVRQRVKDFCGTERAVIAQYCVEE